MKIAAVILVLLAACGVAYCFLVPAHTFIIFRRPDGGTVALSRWSIEFEGPPDRYAAGAFDHIESYVSRLMAQPPKSRWVSMFTPSGDRGFALRAFDGTIEAHLTVEWRQEPEREAAIRTFFGSRQISATEDYLAGNGGVADATRLLAYPLKGNSAEVTALTKGILQELCGISASEALNIKYTEK
jgi:hypothetical protein